MGFFHFGNARGARINGYDPLPFADSGCRERCKQIYCLYGRW